MAYGYQFANNLLESVKQVCISKKNFEWKILFVWGLVILHSTRNFLKETIFFSVNRIFGGGGGSDAYWERCQTSKMERVAKTVSNFLILQNASCYRFYRVLNTSLGWRKAFWNLFEWSHWLGICRSKGYHYFQINQYFKYLS